MNPEQYGDFDVASPFISMFEADPKPLILSNYYEREEVCNLSAMESKNPIDYLNEHTLEAYRYETDLSIIEFDQQENYNAKYIHKIKRHERYANYIEEIAPKHEATVSGLARYALQNVLQQPVKQQIIQNPVSPSIFNSNLLQGQFDYLDLDATKPDELPEMALPVLEFIEAVQPHIVIGCDRGGRLFSLAMHAAWRQTRDGQPFPTLDGKLHFARVSKSEDATVLQEKIDQIVTASLRFGAQRGNDIAEDGQLRVIFVDDWVIGGGTKRLAQQLLKKYDARTYFAVMCGEGANVTGSNGLKTRVSWHDRPEEIGVNYLSTVRANQDGSFSQQQEVLAVRDVKAISNRQRIHQAAKSLPIKRALQQVA